MENSLEELPERNTKPQVLTFEEQRVLRIAANQEKLHRLGLASSLNSFSGSSSSKGPKTSTRAKPKDSGVATRRSSRIQTQTHVPDYCELKQEHRISKRPLSTTVAVCSGGSSVDDSRVKPAKVEHKLKNEFSRRVKVKHQIHQPIYSNIPHRNLEGHYVGQKCSSQMLDILPLSKFHCAWLGQQLLPRGKAPVMQALFDPDSSPDDEALMPVFNRMSGLQCWRNALVLFVNVDGVQYANQFTEHPETNSERILLTWFASSRLHLTSPSIERFVGGQENVLLFCRLDPGPYVYCGRVRVYDQIHTTGVQCLTFRLELEDMNKHRLQDLMRHIKLPLQALARD